MVLINLFSVFDPCSYFNVSLNWIILLLVMLIFPLNYYIVGSKFQKNLIYILISLAGVFNEVAGKDRFAIVFLRVAVFCYLVIENLLRLFSFVFSATAHPVVTIAIGVVVWISFFFIGMVKNFKNTIAHLVPEGSPLVLSFFIVIIESIRHLIRPFTLSIRLAANIIAGHLIINLLSRIRLLGIVRFFRSFFIQAVLLILELGVSVIQGFVFRILLLLYSLEYY